MSDRAPMQEPEVVAALARSAAAVREAGYRFVGSRQSERWYRVADAMLAECEARIGMPAASADEETPTDA